MTVALSSGQSSFVAESSLQPDQHQAWLLKFFRGTYTVSNRGMGQWPTAAAGLPESLLG